jgi:hypothetical protein
MKIDINIELSKIEAIETEASNAPDLKTAERLFKKVTQMRNKLQDRVIESTKVDSQLANALKAQREQVYFRVTRSVNGKFQNRFCGPRTIKNAMKHSVGCIGDKLDLIVMCRHNNRYTPGEIAALCGTKETKVASHKSNEHFKKFGIVYSRNAAGKLNFNVPYRHQIKFDKYLIESGIIPAKLKKKKA